MRNNVDTDGLVTQGTNASLAILTNYRQVSNIRRTLVGN